MKKSLSLAGAIVALAVFSSIGFTQQRGGSQGVVYPTAPIGSGSKAARTVFQSTDTQVNWPAALGRKQGDLVRSLQGQKLTAEVVGSGPQAIIVIYGPDGGCRVCIGGAKACKEACSRDAKDTASPVH